MRTCGLFNRRFRRRRRRANEKSFGRRTPSDFYRWYFRQNGFTGSFARNYSERGIASIVGRF